jgi:excisionase family DNA binding protein
MARFYTVQETAKILGFSTNSVYKFLDQDRLRSTRGNSRQGRFRIPHASIEEFLGTKLSEIAVARALAASTRAQSDAITPRHLISPDTTKEVTPAKREIQMQPEKKVVTKPPLGLAFTRLLILIALLLTIIETITTQSVTLTSQFFRLLILTIAILLAYQSGGSLRDEPHHDQA